jgi:hypothetical protein
MGWRKAGIEVFQRKNKLDHQKFIPFLTFSLKNHTFFTQNPRFLMEN